MPEGEEVDQSASPPSVDLDQAEPTAADAPAERVATQRHALLVALVGIVGVLGTLGASWLQIYGAASTQEAQFAEQRAKEDRSKRDTVYFKFLDTANDYAFAVDEARGCMVKARDAKRPKGSNEWYSDLPKVCVKALADLPSARHDFQASRNRVYVYGSDSAEQRARVLADYLPSALGSDTIGVGLPPLDDRFFAFDLKVFHVLYGDFQEIVCKEVPARPRKNC